MMSRSKVSSPLKNPSCFETLRAELLSTNGFSKLRKQFPFALRRREAPSRRGGSLFQRAVRDIARTLLLALAVAAEAIAQTPLAQPIQTLFNGNGLDGVAALLASPDGRHLYAAGNGNLAIVAQARDASSGRLSRIAVYREGVDGFAGIAVTARMVLAADGRTVFAVGGDAATALRRDVDSGALSPEQTLRGGFGISQIVDAAISPDASRLYVVGSSSLAMFSIDANGHLSHLATLREGPQLDGLAGAAAVDVSADGRYVYVASAAGRSIVAFRSEQSELNAVQTLRPADSALLGEHTDILLAADGSHLYAAVGDQDRITVFRRNPDDGTLAVADSIAEESAGRGLVAPSRLALSSDGRRLYVTSAASSSVALLERNPETDTLSFVRAAFDRRDAVTGIGGSADLALGPEQSHLYVSGPADSAIGLFDAALAFLAVERNSAGAISGLRQPAAIAVAGDGNHVYTAGFSGGGITIFRRAADGTLAYSKVFRGDALQALQQPIALAFTADATVLFAADFGAGSVQSLRRNLLDGDLETVSVLRSSDGITDLRGVVSVAVTPNTGLGAAVSVLSGSAVVFDIASETAALRFRGTMPALAQPSFAGFSGDGKNLYTTSSGGNALLVFGDSEAGPLPEVQVVREADAVVSGLVAPAAVAVSADGGNAYVASGGSIFQLSGSNAVTTFARDPADGSLVFRQALVDGVDGVSGIDGASAVAVSPAGDLVAVTGFSGNSVAIFARDPATGDLGFAEAFFDGATGTAGLGGASALAFSPGGESLYVTGFADNAVTVFRMRTPAPACAGDCDMNGRPAIAELIRCVNVALGTGTLESCPACDVNGDGRVGINELIQAVNAALIGCPA